jgi:regulator of protease activity HflC (stomatin/prohibitin superfamily)
MDSALAWIGYIADWIGKFFPRWNILDTTEGAIKYVRGSNPILCGPGIHWHWPVVTTWVVYPTARQADRLETQTMETEDGKTIIVGGILVYSISDLKALLTTTHSPATTVKDIALSAVHDVCCGMTWEQLKLEQRKGTLDTKLRNAAKKQLSDYGVEVIKLMLTSLARARVLKVSQSMSQEEN